MFDDTEFHSFILGVIIAGVSILAAYETMVIIDNHNYMVFFGVFIAVAAITSGVISYLSNGLKK